MGPEDHSLTFAPTGAGKGTGTTLNVPVKHGAGGKEMLSAIEDRKLLLERVHDAVFSLDPLPRRRRSSAYVSERY